MFSGKNLFPAILVSALLIGTVTATILTITYVTTARELRQKQMQLMGVNRTRAMVQAIAGEAFEYSKRNPAIDPILQSVGIKGKSTATPGKSK